MKRQWPCRSSVDLDVNSSAYVAVSSTKKEYLDNDGSDTEAKVCISDTDNEYGAVTIAVFDANLVAAIAVSIEGFRYPVTSTIKLTAM